MEIVQQFLFCVCSWLVFIERQIMFYDWGVVVKVVNFFSDGVGGAWVYLCVCGLVTVG